MFLPLVLEAVMAPMMLVDRRRAWRTGLTATAGCVLGALIAYFLAAWLYDLLGQDLVALVGGQQGLRRVPGLHADPRLLGPSSSPG